MAMPSIGLPSGGPFSLPAVPVSKALPERQAASFALGATPFFSRAAALAQPEFICQTFW
jgi:hypothetical protein